MGSALPSDDDLSELKGLLDGRHSLDLLASLVSALGDHSSASPRGPFALGLDANILLNLGKGRVGADVVDYLAQRHNGPVIIPSQAINEFWNNHIGAMQGVGDRLRKQFDGLSSAVEALNPAFGDFRRKADGLLRDFESQYGHVLEERVSGELKILFDALLERIIVPQIPRVALGAIAEERRFAKIPPGFKDAGSGDFLVWAEFLFGLRFASADGQPFDEVIFVTDESKSDWSTRGTAHPVLCAEVRAWTSLDFTTWSLQRLRDYVSGDIEAEVGG